MSSLSSPQGDFAPGAPAPAHPHRHGTQRPDGYARRRPEETVLDQTIAEHWPAFSERLAEHGGFPRFVERKFESYLTCGILDFGFLELGAENATTQSSSR
jgi:hypothetical protein